MSKSSVKHEVSIITVIKDNKYLTNIVNIANVCIDLGLWPIYFKISLSIIIPKSNKIAYNSSRMF